MKVIFLDIDGVLNCKSTPNRDRFPYVVDPTLLARFRRLVLTTGAKVVLSSTWRCDPIGILAARHFGVPFDECCADSPGHARGSEIRQWLVSHPGVHRFVVLDDSCDGLGGLPLFQPDDKIGLTVSLAEAIARYLNGETDATAKRGVVVRFCQNMRGWFKRDKS